MINKIKLDLLSILVNNFDDYLDIVDVSIDYTIRKEYDKYSKYNTPKFREYNHIENVIINDLFEFIDTIDLKRYITFENNKRVLYIEIKRKYDIQYIMNEIKENQL